MDMAIYSSLDCDREHGVMEYNLKNFILCTEGGKLPFFGSRCTSDFFINLQGKVRILLLREHFSSLDWKVITFRPLIGEDSMNFACSYVRIVYCAKRPESYAFPLCLRCTYDFSL